MVILGTGTRDPYRFTDKDIEEALDEVAFFYYPHEVLVVHGDAPGFDKKLDAIARRRGYHVQTYPASGFPDPLSRNRYMVDLVEGYWEYEAAKVIAFAKDWASGTGMTARYARSKGLDVIDFGVNTRKEARDGNV